MLGFAGPAAAQPSITLAWDRNQDQDVAGYVLSWGTQPGTYTHSTNVGDVTHWTVTGLDAYRRYYFTVQAYNRFGLLSPRSVPVSNDGIMIQAASGSVPATADQRPSVFWQHLPTGTLLTWHIYGNRIFDSRLLSIPAVSDPAWRVAATADFNGDGHPDILWRHTTQGWLALWLLRDNTVIATDYLSVNRVADLGWQIRGAGDIDRDGYADIVWQHTSGQLGVWLMRGASVLSTLPLSLRVSGTWRIAAVADLDGDRMADLVWQDPANGSIAVWFMNGPAVRSTNLFSVPVVADTAWRIQAAGLFDGTGQPGLLWRHATNGSLALWRVHGATVTQTLWTDPSNIPDLNWVVVGSR